LKKILIFLYLFFSYHLIYSQQFIEVTQSIGITNSNSTANSFAEGACFLDFNNDFLLDIAIGGPNGILLYKNNGNQTFEDISHLAGLYSHTPARIKGIVSGDIDNDGFTDLIAVSKEDFFVYRNNGNEKFSNYSSISNLIPPDIANNKGLAFGDINLDGLLDLYASSVGTHSEILYDTNGNIIGTLRECAEDRFFINNGNFLFTESTSAYNISNEGCGFAPVITDSDNDGDLDILVTNDFGAEAGLDPIFINEYPNPTMTESGTVTGWNDPLYGMGLAVGDYDRDGDLDYYKSSLGVNFLLRNDLTAGNLSFTNVTAAMNVEDTYSTPPYFASAWGAGFFDYDQDGKLDLVFANGHLPSFAAHGFLSHPVTYSKIYKNNYPAPFTDETVALQFDEPEVCRTFSYGDIDNDGDIDLLFTKRKQVTANNSGLPIVFRNDVINKGNWLKVKLEGVVNNRDAIGAHLFIHSAVGSWVHEINSGGQGSGGQHSRIAHFGLGADTVIDSLVIKWPGTATPDQVFYNIDANQFIHIKELDTYYTIITCYNGIKDGDENEIDCGGSICPSCECDQENNTIKHPHSLNVSRSFHYQDHIIFKDNAIISINADIETYAGNFIEIQEGELLPQSGSLILDIDQCILKDLCYHTSLCNLEYFDIEQFDNYSIARIWMEVLLESIRNDFARPTIHARNLHHTSALMYDTWLIYHSMNNPTASNYLVDQILHGFACPMDLSSLNLQADDVDQAISYAMAKLIKHRFSNSPAFSITTQNIFGVFDHFGYDLTYEGSNYLSGNPADIGNYIAQCYIDYGLQDSANEVNGYTNEFYTTVNDPLITNYPGNPNMIDPNHWQPLTLEIFIDQAGNEIPENTPEFLSPEWGEVAPFAMTSSNMTTLARDGHNFNVYYDPTAPPYLDPINEPAMSDEYKWGFMMVSVWGSHLDHNDNTTIDISPAAIGNNNTPWPASYFDLPTYYDFYNGNDDSAGHNINPITGQTYTPQVVKRGDYARVLAEFWADGPDSETPPGHWFTILNYVSDHPSFMKQFEGTGSVLDDLHWDVLSYFTLGGTMHDAAIAAWSVKGYYDYLRPISAIRYMADQGQSSDPALPNYSLEGIPLIPGYSELVTATDPLVGSSNEHLNKIKLYTWKGPDYIIDPETDAAGVDWILAENWWPYQRPSFVTPPFAGYVSGHSTFSRAAAEVMTNMTGSAFFPDGLGEFHAPQNEFLVFEEGPSEDIILQWATYRDASDQCSLSRIWGGIHPPVDDIPGRVMGEQIGINAFNFSKGIIGL